MSGNSLKKNRNNVSFINKKDDWKLNLLLIPVQLKLRSPQSLLFIMDNQSVYIPLYLQLTDILHFDKLHTQMQHLIKSQHYCKAD